MEKTLTESEKKEQLMRPRYKIIADYPGNNMAVGKILTFEWHAENQRIELCFYYDKYPHLFRKLEWWEERTPEEMPEYVRDEVTGKILRIEYRIDSHTPCEVKTWNEFEKPFWNILQDLLPATEAEYNEYLTHSQAGER